MVLVYFAGIIFWVGNMETISSDPTENSEIKNLQTLVSFWIEIDKN
jgi:hypothetical protein